MYKPNYKSKCCKAEIKLESGVPDFEGEDKDSRIGQTYCFICKKCGKPCDILEENNKINA